MGVGRRTREGLEKNRSCLEGKATIAVIEGEVKQGVKARSKRTGI